MTSLTVAAPRKPGRSPARIPGNLVRGWRGLPSSAKVGCVVLGAFILVTLVGPLLAPDDPSLQTAALLRPPSPGHLLGTTSTGQDVLSQMLAGTRETVVVSFAAGAIATVIAAAVGIAAGFLGGVWDEVLSLLSNVFLVLPALPLLVVLLSYQSARGDLGTILVLSALGWPWGARIIRAQTLSLRHRDFVSAARETGERTRRILVYEILPTELNLVAAAFVGAVLYALGASVALSFLGLTDTSQWSLGTMLYWAQTQNALQLGAWWWFLPPGLAVALIGVGLVLVNFGLDELGNPRLRALPRLRHGWRRQPWQPSDPTPVDRGDAGSRKQRPGPALVRTARTGAVSITAAAPDGSGITDGAS